MKTLEEALTIIDGEIKLLATEEIGLEEALYRTLATSVYSPADYPPFDKAAMDGFACRKSDLDRVLSITQEIPAGIVPRLKVGYSECARIMTGAMMPEGADFIIMKEHAVILPDSRIQRNRISQNSNVCVQGEDVKRGDVLLKEGTRIRGPEIAILASAGVTRPLVFKMPSVGILSTGSELVEPEHTPGRGQIRNSNGMQLMAQCMQYGLQPDYEGLFADDPGMLSVALQKAIARHQLVLISGGVSVGDYDFIPSTLEKVGVKVLFHGLKVKPGKHMLLAQYGNTIIAGMPGNPVSSFVMFEVIIRAVLNKMTGTTGDNGFFISLATDFNRTKSDTVLYLPATIDRSGNAVLKEYHGSAHIQAFSSANAIMEVPLGVGEIKKGEMVYVRPL